MYNDQTESCDLYVVLSITNENLGEKAWSLAIVANQLLASETRDICGWGELMRAVEVMCTTGLYLLLARRSDLQKWQSVVLISKYTYTIITPH